MAWFGSAPRAWFNGAAKSATMTIRLAGETTAAGHEATYLKVRGRCCLTVLGWLARMPPVRTANESV